MRRITFILFALLLFTGLTGCNRTDVLKMTPELTGDIKTDMIAMLPEGTLMADILGFKQSQRQRELTAKFQAGVQKNYQWFVKYLKTIPSGTALPYHPNFGYTEAEHNELQGFLKNLELGLLRRENVTISRSPDILTVAFMGELKNQVGAITINFKDNTVTMAGYTLPFERNVNVDENTPLKSKWRGYTWRFSEPKELVFEMLNDTSKLIAKKYVFSVGRLEKDGKTFINVEGREVENGVQTVHYNIPLILDSNIQRPSAVTEVEIDD